jgi:hypothetical protein
MPRFTTASAIRSSSARSSTVNRSGPELVEKAWASSARILLHFPGRTVLVEEAISVWKGSRNQLSSGIIWRGGKRVNERRGKGWRLIDLLCSRNARLKKALVGRAQWEINQPPSPKRERVGLERALCTSFDGRSRISMGAIP